MKILKILTIILVSILVLLLIITAFLPTNFSVQRSIEIKSPAWVSYNLVNNLHNWVKWDPWMDMDSLQKREYQGIPGEKGSLYKWDSKNPDVGRGKMVITDNMMNKLVKTDLYMDEVKFGQSDFIFEEKNGITKVTWTVKGELKFFDRWVGVMMDAMMGSAFEKGLSKIKAISEKTPIVKVKCSITSVPAQNILFIKDSINGDMSQIGVKLGKAYQEIMDFMKKNNIEMSGPPLCITNSYSKNAYNFDAGIPFNSTNVKTEGRIKLGVTPSGKVVLGEQLGPYDQAEASYNIIFKYIAENKLKERGKSWEVYINDPTTVKPEEILTFVYVPVE